MNLGLQFSYPWLLLLILPALALGFIPYFRLSPKYRRTRNRITSLVLFLVIALLAIVTLAGMVFTYREPNTKNEIILLVDVSDTEEQSKTKRDEFVSTVLHDGSYDNFKVGVVLFGFDQKYAVPLTDRVSDIYDRYLDALEGDLPDTSATDIASALGYAKGLFDNPETGKIVLITDGKETDGKAVSVARAISASGIKIDVANIESYYSGADVQVVGVKLPDYHVVKGEECTITLSLKSRVDGVPCVVTLTDTGATKASTVSTDISLIAGGVQTIDVPVTFSEDGLHKLDFTVTNVSDEKLLENNVWTTYMSLENFNSVLILERESSASEKLKGILEENGAFVTEVMNFTESDSVPLTVNQLRAYDQVIMNNVSTMDMQLKFGYDRTSPSSDESKAAKAQAKAFQEALYSYVEDFGGSVFTVGGDTDDNKANLFNRQYMAGSVYQQMLPVQAIDYTPPLGVIIIIDRSGSMSQVVGSTGQSRLFWALSGAKACLNAMSERDYIGIMTLDNNSETLLPLTPRPQESKILAAITNIEESGGGTIATNAIESAGVQLGALKVEKKHIILVSDGELGDEEESINKAKENLANGITLSVVQIGGSPTGEAIATRLAEAGEGRVYTDDTQIVMNMREDLNVPEIKDVIMVDFKPTIKVQSSNLVRGLDTESVEGSIEKRLTVTLGGFYGTRVRNEAELVLTGEYNVPLYAQWTLGKGKVGSFMCDIGGKWSTEFVSDPNGKRFIRNVVGNLMPTENIRPKDIEIEVKEDNYTNKLTVYTELGEGERIVGKVIDAASGEKTEFSLNEASVSTDSGLYTAEALSAENAYTKSTFIIKKSGVYKVVVEKIAADGTVKSAEVYKTFSYSKEYETFSEETAEDIANRLKTIATRGNGSYIEDLTDPEEVYKDFVTSFKRTFDPRIIFMILVIVLFLLDMIVRKFKFKWPHEIIRAAKEKRNGKKQ